MSMLNHKGREQEERDESKGREVNWKDKKKKKTHLKRQQNELLFE